MADKGRLGAKERGLDSELLSFSIDDRGKHIKQEKAWKSGDRNAVTLVKNASMRVALVGLRKGASLREHRVEGPITVYVVQGALTFTIGRDKRVLKRSGFLMLDRKISHDVEALEDSLMLLTIIQPI